MSDLDRKQRERGFSDAKAGHSPSLLRGAYMEGYVQGRSRDTLDHEFRLPPDPRDEKIAELKALLASCLQRRNELVKENERLTKLMERLKTSGDLCSCCIDYECDCLFDD